MEALLILVIFAGVIALIGSPFFKGTTEVWEKSAVDSKLNKLAAAKEAHYKAIKDVDFEYAEGKLSEKDYNELRNYYKEKAIMTVREMETLGKGGITPSVKEHGAGHKEHKKGKKEHK